MAQQRLDPYSPVLVEEIIGGLNEWKSVQDVVKLAVKALVEVVKTQGMAIRDMEQTVIGKVSKTDYAAQMALKANAVDVQSGFSSLAAEVNSKLGLEELQHYLDDKPSKGDLQLALRSKPDLSDYHAALESKADLSHFQRESRSLSLQIESLKHELSSHFQSSVSLDDFKRISDSVLLKANKEDVEKALEEKAGKLGVKRALEMKVSRGDLESWMARKVDVTELERVLEGVKTKAESSFVEKLSQSVSLKADREEIAGMIGREMGKTVGKGDLEGVSREVERGRKELEERLQQQTVEVRTYSTMMQKEVERLQTSINVSLSKKADARSFEYLSSLLQSKVDASHLTTLLSALKSEYHDAFQSLSEEIKALEERYKVRLTDNSTRLEGVCEKLEEELGRVKDAMRVISDRNRDDMTETVHSLRSDASLLRTEWQAAFQAFKSTTEQQLTLLSQSKADLTSLQELRAAIPAFNPATFNREMEDWKREMSRNLEDIRREGGREKVDMKVISEITGKKADVTDLERLKGQLMSDLARKADQSTLENHIKHTENAFSSLSKDLNPSISPDFLSLLNQKADIDDINSALDSLHVELEGKQTVSEFHAFQQDQGLINEALCGENCLARFIWKSGDLRGDGTIPWEVQSVNMCPDNFLWESDRPTIVTVVPGLYELLIGIFARKPPGIRVLVNGETVLGIGDSERQVTRHSAGNVAGTTAVEFLALPARARISLVYSGDVGGEGFLSLRKL